MKLYLQLLHQFGSISAPKFPFCEILKNIRAKLTLRVDL